MHGNVPTKEVRKEGFQILEKQTTEDLVPCWPLRDLLYAFVASVNRLGKNEFVGT